ncbi:uncharacterized protein L969DRAFT_94132 [Mixia osmundae IAM 14324]|uniref:Protection of telomeres protein 1 ssDNA-binding domain-containing protein n=1 Tax=Mixia osmundae (strain CBS 9802 / IAM 14324 / JCM 22182 / KY 12970) TaxID=764103 RepID=G7E2R3_MIXOS|nr:uncharacterized protein L969DRAFT_94132 [Mixia osmundae IAM 14324]KEI40326.1 hypothetical protein L969DRAFT_94132 [Mixia osmundae IAM 14324]GAA97123.1 hypothetical protein E5Q_03798 [Mixia osmundae IAM 14324]
MLLEGLVVRTDAYNPHACILKCRIEEFGSGDSKELQLKGHWAEELASLLKHARDVTAIVKLEFDAIWQPARGQQVDEEQHKGLWHIDNGCALRYMSPTTAQSCSRLIDIDLRQKATDERLARHRKSGKKGKTAPLSPHKAGKQLARSDSSSSSTSMVSVGSGSPLNVETMSNRAKKQARRAANGPATAAASSANSFTAANDVESEARREPLMAVSLNRSANTSSVDAMPGGDGASSTKPTSPAAVMPSLTPSSKDLQSEPAQRKEALFLRTPEEDAILNETMSEYYSEHSPSSLHTPRSLRCARVPSSDRTPSILISPVRVLFPKPKLEPSEPVDIQRLVLVRDLKPSKPSNVILSSVIVHVLSVRTKAQPETNQATLIQATDYTSNERLPEQFETRAGGRHVLQVSFWDGQHTLIQSMCPKQGMFLEINSAPFACSPKLEIWELKCNSKYGSFRIVPPSEARLEPIKEREIAFNDHKLSEILTSNGKRKRDSREDAHKPSKQSRDVPPSSTQTTSTATDQKRETSPMSSITHLAQLVVSIRDMMLYQRQTIVVQVVSPDATRGLFWRIRATDYTECCDLEDYRVGPVLGKRIVALSIHRDEQQHISDVKPGDYLLITGGYPKWDKASPRGLEIKVSQLKDALSCAPCIEIIDENHPALANLHKSRTAYEHDHKPVQFPKSDPPDGPELQIRLKAATQPAQAAQGTTVRAERLRLIETMVEKSFYDVVGEITNVYPQEKGRPFEVRITDYTENPRVNSDGHVGTIKVAIWDACGDLLREQKLHRGTFIYFRNGHARLDRSGDLVLDVRDNDRNQRTRLERFCKTMEPDDQLLTDLLARKQKHDRDPETGRDGGARLEAPKPALTVCTLSSKTVAKISAILAEQPTAQRFHVRARLRDIPPATDWLKLRNGKLRWEFVILIEDESAQEMDDIDAVRERLYVDVRGEAATTFLGYLKPPDVDDRDAYRARLEIAKARIRKISGSIALHSSRHTHPTDLKNLGGAFAIGIDRVVCGEGKARYLLTDTELKA